MEPLYPKEIDDQCPYCGSTEKHDYRPTRDASNRIVGMDCKCWSCDRDWRLGLDITSITLFDADDKPHIHAVGYEIPDMSKEGEADQPTTLIAPIKMGDGVFIMAQGYGDGNSAEGYGCPAIIEMHEGRLRVIAWGDINGDDVSEIIDLERSQYKHQKADADHPFSVQLFLRTGEKLEEQTFEKREAAETYALNLAVPFGQNIKVFEGETELFTV